MKQELEQVRGWAQDKLNAGQEPPWAWYQYMKLVEALDALLAGMAATKRLQEGSPELASRPAMPLRLAACNGSQDTAQFHLGSAPAPLPM